MAVRVHLRVAQRGYVMETGRIVLADTASRLLAVSLVVIFFLFHWRSALIILIQMPISIAVAFILLVVAHIAALRRFAQVITLRPK